MLNNMLTSIGTLTFGQSLVLSGIGMLVVLMDVSMDVESGCSVLTSFLCC